MNIKDKIKEKVNNINDPRLLDELLKAVDLEYEIDQLEELSDLEKRAIDKGIEDADAGKLFNSDEANEMLKGWLKK